MSEILDQVNGKGRGPVNVQPLFITCDPARDDPKALKIYLAGKLISPRSPVLTWGDRIPPGYHWIDGGLR